jgi:hypothetical protein
MGPLRPHSFHTSAAAVLGYIQEIIIMSGKSVGSSGVLRSGVKFNVIPETLESSYKDVLKGRRWQRPSFVFLSASVLLFVTVFYGQSLTT